MTRDERETELKAMTITEQQLIYMNLTNMTPGELPPPGTMFVYEILKLEFPGEK